MAGSEKNTTGACPALDADHGALAGGVGTGECTSGSLGGTTGVGGSSRSLRFPGPGFQDNQMQVRVQSSCRSDGVQLLWQLNGGRCVLNAPII